MMKSGRYWIGDLCYVVSDDSWPKFCDEYLDDSSGGEFTTKDGIRFAMYSTAYGDGTYVDGSNNEFPVDSGTIGCIEEKHIERVDNVDLGLFVEFDEDFSTGVDDGTITFGHVWIDTKGDDHEDDYEDEE